MKIITSLPICLLITLILSSCSSSNNNNTKKSITQTGNFSTFQAANVVIGQPDLTSSGYNQGIGGNGGAVDANTLASPYGNSIVSNNVLYLPDTYNHRLLMFNSLPTANNTHADYALGQSDLTSRRNGRSSTRFNAIGTVAISDGKMFLNSMLNNRILIWNSVPTTGGLVAADVVLGQASFSSVTSACSETGLNQPSSVAVTNSKIVVADYNHHRVLIWNSIPTTNNTKADIVLGQQNFTQCTANNGSSGNPSAATLNNPSGVWTDGTRLVVVDSWNNRVLIWNTFPSTNFQAADVVVGQSDFVHKQNNDDNQDNAPETAPTARTLFGPHFGIFSDGTQLFVADSNNNRILVWNNFPTKNFTPADAVLGQSDFVHYIANDDNQDGKKDINTSPRTLDSPIGLYLTGKKLLINDNGNNRYLIYNSK